MNDRYSVSEASSPDHQPEPPSKEKVQWFLVRSVVLLMFLDLVIYLITRDNGVLLISTIIGVAATAVFSYYFSSK